ncbi:helix-turn-helix domain-containing protein [Petroclostridium sp. X23]|uniref:helix-turn-helix domain-containing protein n=1 Tax=Petroclostridium sp. X23 TaxID=3045146 RepID=UPI0024ACFA03|nr:helix-turn-helix domain-containing protein [Petroclostridium sp. X23]WHH59070.1 helix-turn-helix domain-containing protein [Petroclostridium sp. X23]
MQKRFIYNYKFNSVFIKTFVILILTSIIPVVAANTIIYRKSTMTIQKQTRNTNMNMLGKTSETVDLVFKQIDQTMQQIAKDPSIVNSIINPDINSIGRNSKIISNLKNIASTNNYILSIYVYSAFNQTIISSSGGVYKLEEFYDKEWLKEYDNFILGTHQMETRKISDALGNQYNGITFFRNLPYASWSKLGAIIINVSEDKLYETIAGLDMEVKGQFYVANAEGKILIHEEKDKLYTNIDIHDRNGVSLLVDDRGFFINKVGGKQTLFTYVTSPYNEWKYFYAIPLEYLQTDSAIISRLIVITTLIYILLGLILSFLISKGVYNPIEKLMNLVLAESKQSFYEENFDGKDEYEFLGYAYNQVVGKNKSMEDIITSMKPVMKEKLLTSLLLGKVDSLKEISEKLSFLELDFSLKNYVVIVMQIDNYSEFCSNLNEVDRNLYTAQLVNVIEERLSGEHKGVCIEVESDKVAAIINFNEEITLIEAKKQSSIMAAHIKDEVEKHFPFTITLGIGRMYKEITNVQLSYNEAVNALKYKIYQGKNEIINIDDVEQQTEELYYYDSEKERMLINNLKVGHQKEVDQLIDELCQEILDNRNISYTYVQQVFIRVISSIIELIINLGMTTDEVFEPGYNMYEDFSNKETIEDIKFWLSGICGTIIDNVNNLNQTRSQKYVEKILEYIDENLSSEISLNDIADYVGLSPTYVSKIFKDSMGKNYVDYLNASRIEKAKQLLKNTQLAVKEIGFRVGFNTIQTFMRTFKKYEGITPGQFRDKM